MTTKQMSVGLLILWLGGAGMLGGFVNAFLSSDGFIMPKMQTLTDGSRIFRPGFLGNILVGSVAAVALGCLSGPLGAAHVGTSIDSPSLANIAAALLTGIGGARLLTQEVDRKFQDATKKGLGQAMHDLVKPGP